MPPELSVVGPTHALRRRVLFSAKSARGDSTVIKVGYGEREYGGWRSALMSGVFRL